ncbi:hypothetical protein AB0I84_40325, partial [Streptomyces spectabilis]
MAAPPLADSAGVQAGPLRRVLRLLASRDVLHERGDGTFRLTPAAEPLRQARTGLSPAQPGGAAVWERAGAPG